MRFPIISSGSKLPVWFSNIKELPSSGKWQEVLYKYNEIKQAGVQLIDPSIFPPILKACVAISFRCGKSVHASLVKQGFESYPSVQNSIMDFYAKSGALGSAMGVFYCMTKTDAISWNIIIYGHLHLGASKEGLELFIQGREVGFEPNISTIVLVIQAYHSLGALDDGLKFHGYLIQSGFWSLTSVQNSLLSMYVDIGMEFARKLFDDVYDKDVISWTVMIGGYMQSDESLFALELFKQMVSESGIKMDGQIMVGVLKAYANLGDIRMAKLVHGFIVSRNLDYDLFVGNSLVDLYCKCSDVDSAFTAFREMPQRNIVSWNSLLSGFVRNQKYSEALVCFHLMGNEGVDSDEVTVVNLLQICKYIVHLHQCELIHSRILRKGFESNELVINSLIDAYAKCDRITHAWRQFCQIKRRDAVTWSTMISGFANCGMPDEAIAVYREMRLSEENPNHVTLINLLEACALSAELRRSKWAHGIAIRMGMASNVAVGTAILDMYSKCGSIEASRKAFDQIPQKTIVSWGAIIAAHGLNGLPHDALALLSKMKVHGLKPNLITALSVLSACSHGGLVEEGLSLFKELTENHGAELRLEHYSCLVDLLARAGKLDSAFDMIMRIPTEMKPSASAWGALLSACRNYENTELGAGALDHVLELEPSVSAGYLLASNIYAAGGSWVDASRMRWMVKERGIKMVAGYSLVHIDNKPHRFVAGDNSHPMSDELCSVIEQMHSCMKMDMRAPPPSVEHNSLYT
ncbi:Tetratricopeptide repeat (TPR)-like superfamily protein [Abeliophyllum distichum]|uniref:Tetratricopeptide repeat (TPR)-like superfamily protein n=1 Tax=Abeliophyllum distichum TaxID=126358 RepID=A0ABD1RAE4_9LAMI